MRVVAEVSSSSETAEKVRAWIQGAVSRQVICLDRPSQARRTAALTSPFRVDPIAAGVIDFFSGLVEIGRNRSTASTAHRACSAQVGGVPLPQAQPWRHVLEQETSTVMPSAPADHRPIYFFPLS
jgi:hypothetical protein